MATARLRCGAIITYSPGFKAGDPPPEGYLDWHEWAEVQRKAGLKQELCGRCSRWKFPQELSGRTGEYPVVDRHGRPRTMTFPICNGCAAKVEAETP